MKSEVKLVEGKFVERALATNIECPDSSRIWFHREDAQNPVECKISRPEMGWVDRITGEVFINLEGKLYNVTKGRFSTRSPEDVKLALLTSYQSIVSNIICMWYGSDRNKTIFNFANTIACSTKWEDSLETKQHVVMTAYHHEKSVEYHDVVQAEAYLKEKFSCIYMATPDGIIGVPLRPFVNIRAAS